MVRPVPPLLAVRAVAKVSAPVDENDEVAVAPKDACDAVRTLVKSVVVVAFDAISPPLKLRSVVVALLVKR